MIVLQVLPGIKAKEPADLFSVPGNTGTQSSVTAVYKHVFFQFSILISNILKQCENITKDIVGNLHSHS